MSALDNALKKLQKKYEDPGIILDLRKGDTLPPIERVDIDSPKIGDLFGKGGYPRGRIIEISGPFSGGKTSLASYLAGLCQKTIFETVNETSGKVTERNGTILFIDAEQSLDAEYAAVHGFDVNQCILVQPDNGEQALDIVIKAVETGEVDMVIIDSIAALTPKAEIEADMDQMQMGLQARLITKFLRKANSIVKKTKTTLICINQTRQNLGFGGSTITPGGNALKFYASVRIEVKRIEWTLKGTETVGLLIQMTCTKNKTAPPRKKYKVTMTFDKGFDAHLEWIDFAIDLGTITKLSSVMYANQAGMKIKGKKGVTEYYSDPVNAEEYEEIIKRTRNVMAQKVSSRVSVDSKEDEEAMEADIAEMDRLAQKAKDIGLLDKLAQAGEEITSDGEIIEKPKRTRKSKSTEETHLPKEHLETEEKEAKNSEDEEAILVIEPEEPAKQPVEVEVEALAESIVEVSSEEIRAKLDPEVKVILESGIKSGIEMKDLLVK